MVLNKLTLRKKIGRIILSIFLSLLVFESLLHITGFVLSVNQRYKNQISSNEEHSYRILALGESNTADLFNGQSSWPAELEHILNNRSSVIKFKVFNGGIPAIDSTYILNNLEENLRKYNPDMVIAMMGFRDIRIKEETTKKNKLILFFMKFKVVKLFDLIYSHWGDRLSNIKRNIYKKMFKKSSDASLRKGISYYDLFHHTRSRGNTKEMFKKSIELSPEDYIVYVQLGAFYHAQHKLESAEKMLKKAVELDSENDIAYVGLGMVYKEQKKFKNAEEMFKKAIELNPDNDRVYLELGWSYHSQGKVKKAEDTFKQGIKLNPYNEEADSGVEELYLGLGFLYDIQGKSVEAKDVYNKLSKIEGSNPVLSENYQRMYRILNEKGIKFAVMQYPSKKIDEFKSMFDESQQKNILFISNEENFKNAINNAGIADYFVDMFGGSFGHCTLRGNRLIAENVADVIIENLA